MVTAQSGSPDDLQKVILGERLTKNPKSLVKGEGCGTGSIDKVFTALARGPKCESQEDT